MRRGTIALVSMLVFLLVGGCGEDYASIETLMDPQACVDCHPQHVREWASSMHAYAADDPMFVAMNARGQRETAGALGDFCVKCHAPMAVELGLTTDGLNLDELDQAYKGVTCYVCHSVQSVEGTHNNPLVLASDGVLRGGFADATSNGFHRTAYSPYLDGDAVAESSKMCGACHDIVTPAGVAIERTYAEYIDSVFHKPKNEGGLSCSGCHMFQRTDVVADFPGVPLRDRHEHLFNGFDLALTPWPDIELQRAAIERDSEGSIFPRLCVNPGAGGIEADYILDNIGAGHNITSGAAADRRMWVELIAYDAAGEIIASSGVVGEGEPVVDVAAADPSLWQIRDTFFDAEGKEVHMFWEVARVESNLLPPAVTNDPTDPRYVHTVTRRYEGLGEAERITARVRLRPVGLDFADDLIASGDLQPAIRERIPTIEFTGTQLSWQRSDGFGCFCTTGACQL